MQSHAVRVCKDLCYFSAINWHHFGTNEAAARPYTYLPWGHSFRDLGSALGFCWFCLAARQQGKNEIDCRKECFHFFDAIDYIEHVITPTYLHATTKPIVAVKELKYPKATTELCSYLEHCVGYRRLNLNFSLIVAPFNERLRKGNPTTFKLNEKELRTAGNLKEKLVVPPSLALRRPKEQLISDKDACYKQF